MTERRASAGPFEREGIRKKKKTRTTSVKFSIATDKRPPSCVFPRVVRPRIYILHFRLRRLTFSLVSLGKDLYNGPRARALPKKRFLFCRTSELFPSSRRRWGRGKLRALSVSWLLSSTPPRPFLFFFPRFLPFVKKCHGSLCGFGGFLADSRARSNWTRRNEFSADFSLLKLVDIDDILKKRNRRHAHRQRRARALVFAI